MTSLKVRDSLDSNKGKFIGLISLLTRTALEAEDSFDDIPEDVLKDLIRRYEEE
jgi:hypothetical protein